MVPGGHLPRVPPPCDSRPSRTPAAPAGRARWRSRAPPSPCASRKPGAPDRPRCARPSVPHPEWSWCACRRRRVLVSHRFTVPSTFRSTTPGCAAPHQPRVWDASGSAGGRWFSSSASFEPGWSSVVTTVMKGRARWSVTRLRSRPPQVVRFRRVLGRGEVHETHPRHEPMTIRRSAQGVPAQAGRPTKSPWARGTRRTPVRVSSRTPQTGSSRTAQGNHAGSNGPAQRLPERPDETSTRASASEPPRGTAGRDPHQGSTAHARGRRPSSSDTRSEASRITCETRAEGRPREPTAWGRGARGRFLGRPVSPESCGKVPIDRGDAFSWPHRGRLIGLDT